jgi:hypothetical protein
MLWKCGSEHTAGQQPILLGCVSLQELPYLKISEAANLQVRVQAYNLLNHVNGFVPNHNVQYNAQGVLTDSNAGKDLSVQRPRQLEFSLKLIF